ncbi:FAD-binding oxidoreductase [Pseudonocardia endophytica]|uniref:FAD/FMN-containing dehydrogenase n=1 Tax=Pseudonocardia endophytica TaxID=401976 RepID=A0A4R1HYN1_PSEEN|nr:FAD-binding oxidoreductase [Pseudonocardia endophytica]TCK26673.1 FAD/FMN-containing dehydrogenase [Pseudonocardia endophytica]
MTTILPPDETLSTVVGPVFRATDEGYTEEVMGFNVAYMPSPSLVVGATCDTDVAAAVRYATELGLPVAVQSTGHGLLSDLNGAVLVSTRRMTGCTVDPVARTARVQAGVRWREVIDAAAPYGLAPLNGSSSTVGVVGYTTGGGLGPMARRHGFAADHVLSATVVTGDGEIRTVDAERDPDLFWAVRGGKGTVGIVTEIEFELVEQPRFYGGGIFFPGEAAPELLHAWREWAPTLPEDTTTSVALLALPPDPQLPPPLQGRFVTHLRFTHLGSADEGAELIAPMRAVAEPIMDLVDEMPYAAVDAVHMDPQSPMPCWDRGTTLSSLPAEAVEEILAEAGPDSSSPLVLVELRLMGGAIARAPRVPNAVAGRDAAFSLYCLGVPAGPDAAVQVPARCSSLVESLAPWAAGGLVNFYGQAGPARLGSLWSDADRARLLDTKRRYDPAGVFRTNVVIG